MIGLVLYGLALILVLVSPALGLMAAAVATWQALLAGSVWYMPLGLVLVLACIALVYSHKLLDFGLLGLLLLGIAGWLISDNHQQAHMLGVVQDLAGRVGLVPGLLVIAILTIALLFTTVRTRRASTPYHRGSESPSPVLHSISAEVVGNVADHDGIEDPRYP